MPILPIEREIGISDFNRSDWLKALQHLEVLHIRSCRVSALRSFNFDDKVYRLQLRLRSIVVGTNDARANAKVVYAH